MADTFKEGSFISNFNEKRSYIDAGCQRGFRKNNRLGN